MLTFASSVALEDYIRETRALINSFRDHADTLEKHLQTTLSVLPAGQLIRKPTTWKPADDIERILEQGAKTMRREELIQVLVENKLVGGDGADDPQRHQYATEAIRRGLKQGYLSENGDETVHWVPA